MVRAGGERGGRFHGSGSVLERQRHTHAATHAQGRYAPFGLAFEHFVQQGDRDPRASATDGMAERDRATIDVEFRTIEMQFPIASQNLSSKSFIELYQIEISQAELML